MSFPSALWTQTNFDLGPRPGFTLQRTQQIFTSVPLSLWTQTNFDLGSLSLGLVSQILLTFVLLSLWTQKIYIGFVSLGLLDQTDSLYSALWTKTNFDLGSLSLSLVSPKFIGANFAQPRLAS